MTRWPTTLAIGFGLLFPPVSSTLAQSPDRGAGSLTATSSASLTDVPDRSSLTVRGAFYIPAYTNLALTPGRIQIEFAVSLSIHNTSSAKPLVVERIAYHDTGGRLLQEYVSGPVAIRPFGAIEVSVPANDLRGGTGANFVVDWAAAGAIAEPIMETLVVGTLGPRGYSFVGHGRAIRIVGERQ